MQEQIDGFLTYLEVQRGYSANTVAAYRNDLGQFLAYLRAVHRIEIWPAVDTPMIAGYIQHLKHDREYSPATVSRKVAAVKSFFHYLGAVAGLISGDPTAPLETPTVERQRPRSLTPAEVDRLLVQPHGDDGPKALRDTAMLQMLYATGMRVSELVALNTDDISLASGTVRCFGKAARERVVPMDDRALDALREYLDEGRVAYLKRRDERALFLNLRGTRLTRQGLWLIIRDYVRAAGIESEVTPQTLRHSFAAHLVDGGVGLREVQRLLGHTNLSTTQVYAAPATGRKESAQ